MLKQTKFQLMLRIANLKLELADLEKCIEGGAVHLLERYKWRLDELLEAVTELGNKEYE